MDLMSVILSHPYVISSLLSFFMLLLYFITHRRPNNYPPGPIGLPLIGVLHLLGKTPERAFQNWSERYGAVISVRIGMKDSIVLNDHESIHEAFVKNKELVSGRDRNPIYDIVSGENYGLILLDYGQKWKTQRKFAVHCFRGLGVGKKSVEDRVIEEASCLCNAIKEFNGKPFDIKDILSNVVANSISSVTVGKRFDYNDPKVVKVLSLLERILSNPVSNLSNFFITMAPCMRHIPPFSAQLEKKKQCVNLMLEILDNIVEEHKSTLDPEHPRDFVDAFLLEVYNGQDSNFTKMQLRYFLQNLLFAGTETTSNTLRWAIVVMLHYPEAQKRLREEIKLNIGKSMVPSFSEKVGMPYTCAFMEELFRFRTVTPFALPHKTSEKVKIGIFTIPAETQVIPNIWAVHNDPKVFSEPEAFKPERHLDSDGNFVKSKHVIPFSIGARHCLGEKLARMEVFIFLVSLVQKFNLRPVSEEDLPEINKGIYGEGFIPLPYEMVAEECK